MSFHDIRRIQGNGKVFLPLSSSRLYAGQSPEQVYDWILAISSRLEERTVDFIILYTNNLYSHTSELTSSASRLKANFQMLSHKQSLLNLIKEKKEFSPSIFHFVPWDYTILKAKNYLDLRSKLIERYENDKSFHDLVRYEIGRRNLNLSNIEFIIEETVVTYLIREKLVSFPQTLSNSGAWHLVAYPGDCLLPDIYINQQSVFPSNKKAFGNDYFLKLMSTSMYNLEKKLLVNYSKVNLNEYIEEQKKEVV